MIRFSDILLFIVFFMTFIVLAPAPKTPPSVGYGVLVEADGIVKLPCHLKNGEDYGHLKEFEIELPKK